MLNIRKEEQPITADPSGLQGPEEGRFNFSQGQSVRIVDGPFIEFVGKVIESSRERKKVTVLISYFGKETPFLFDFRQVEKIEPFFI
jgi:transcription antitermination factor NusG